MNDNDIIKALECCGNQMYSCTDKRCKAKTLGEAHDLIIRQKAEIERLKERIEEEKHALFEQQAYTAELQKEIDATYKLLELKREEERREHELNMDALKEIKSILPSALSRARTEAYKEFAVRLKYVDLYQCIEEYYKNAELCYEVRQDWFCEQIDNLVKEMTEEQE